MDEARAIDENIGSAKILCHHLRERIDSLGRTHVKR
jgi:hypothetical protein